MRKFIPGFVDPAGTIMTGFGGFQFGLINEGSGAPTNSVQGYQTGALWFRRDGGVDTAIYLNVGNETSSTWVPLASSPLNGLLATAAELNRTAKNSTRPVAAGGAALTVTQALHDGKTVLLDQATGTAVTLPIMSGSGARYRFGVTITKSGGSDVITATAAHLFGGMVVNTDGALAAGTLWVPGFAASPAGSTVITLNGGTTGGRKGDWFEIEDVAAGIGLVRGFVNASGTEATPFS